MPEIFSTVLRRTLTSERRREGGGSEVLDSVAAPALLLLLDLRKERSGISGVVGLVGEDMLAREAASGYLWRVGVGIDDGALSLCCWGFG